MQKIVLASGNKGKLKEFDRLLAPASFQVILQSELGVPEVDETGLSFVENAIIKARHACEHAKLPALADDSGLEVDVLSGRPGIYSARYSGPGATDTSNNQKLLAELEGTDEAQRGARYYCALVFMRHAQDPCPLIFLGSLAGRILRSPIGDNGFGYDPLFWVPQYDCSAAQMSPELKSRISHRAVAMRGMMAQLERLASAVGQ